MTKARPPLSFADAVERVVRALPGEWAEAAQAVGKAERTVRNWSDPDADALPTIAECLQLDTAFLKYGSGEPPLLAAYALKLAAAREASAVREALAESAGEAMREAGRFGAAALMAARPGAAMSEIAAGIREGLDTIRAVERAVASLEALQAGGG